MVVRPSILIALALVAVLAAPATAQTRYDIGPLLGLYAPIGNFRPTPYYTTILPNSPSDLTGLAWGGQGRIWFTRRFGVQLQVASASSTVGGGCTPGGCFSGRPARVLTASAQGLYTSSSPPQRVRVWLGAGAGLVHHGGAAYAPFSSPLQFATALGIGSAISLGGHVTASLGVTTLLYYIDVSDSTGTSLEHGFQVDPLIHAGLSWGGP